MTNTYRLNRAYLLVVSAIVIILLCGCTKFVWNTAFQTCQRCGSTREIKTDASGRESVTITYKSPMFAACSHLWERGINSGMNPPIPDRRIVLVKKGNTLGAFIPRNQNTEPERLDFDWYYRNDGKGTFRPGEVASFAAGKGSGTVVRFGPFNIHWSGNAPGMGYVYYDRFPGKQISPNDTRIRATVETDITKVDAADNRWVYRGSPTDRGVHADGKMAPTAFRQKN